MELSSEDASRLLGRKIASLVKPPMVLTFSGPLGAGKTTLIRAILKSLGIEGSVKSPTFSIVESYTYAHVDYHHFDLYRLQNSSTLEEIGFRDFFNPNAVCLIEWPERVENMAIPCDLAFTLQYDQEQRLLKMHAYTDIGKKLLEEII